MSSEDHKHCLCGEIHSGVPTGKFEDIAGFKTYIATPENAQKDKAIFYITDVFAFDLVNHLLLADTYAEETGVTVYIPDFTEGDPVPLNAFQVGFDFGKWLGTHNIEKVLGFSHKFLSGLKEKHGVTHVATVGFCWGGYFSVELATHPDLVDAVIALHPSFLEVPKHVEHITKPSLWICAETDNQFDDPKRKGTQEILEKKGLPNKFVFYPGTTHGFSVRGNENDAHIAKAAKGAKDETVKFIREVFHL